MIWWEVCVELLLEIHLAPLHCLAFQEIARGSALSTPVNQKSKALLLAISRSKMPITTRSSPEPYVVSTLKPLRCDKAATHSSTEWYSQIDRRITY